MAFKRVLKTEYISESDNVWIDNPFKDKDGVEKIHLVGTRCTCVVRDEETSLLRATTFMIAPEYAIEDKQSQELIEDFYLACEWSLKKALAKKSSENVETELKADEFRSQNIV